MKFSFNTILTTGWVGAIHERAGLQSGDPFRLMAHVITADKRYAKELCPAATTAAMAILLDAEGAIYKFSSLSGFAIIMCFRQACS